MINLIISLIPVTEGLNETYKMVSRMIFQIKLDRATLPRLEASAYGFGF